MSGFSTKHIGYLERDYLDSPQGKLEDSIPNFSVPEADSIRFVKVVGISKSWEQYKEKIVSLRYLMGDTIAGLYGEKIPLIYLIVGEPSKVNVFVGTYPNKDGGSGIRQESDGNRVHYVFRTSSTKSIRRCKNQVMHPGNLSALITSLKSAYPGIDLVEQDEMDLQVLQDVIGTFDFTGIVMGTPMSKVGTDEIGVEQVERLIRGLYGTNWGYMVIAKPIVESEIVELFNSVLNEQRIIADAEKSANMSSPIAEKYQELLGILLEKLELGKTQGMWHTAVYGLSSDVRVFNRAKSVIKAVFGGKESRPDPIRVFECHNLKKIIHKFAHITTPSPQPPGKIKYPFKYLNLLNSWELTSLVHLPTEEMPGYFVKDYARFDVASHQKTGDDVIEIGEVIDRGKKMGYEYRMEVKHLDRHALIVGMTGSGKTNTIFHLLKQVCKKGIPFMVIEPAKTEYRKLLHGEFGKDLQVFTLGDDTTSPFRLNPFEIMPGVSVQTHIDLLKSVFNASFILYAPMPYVLERCIHEIYEDKGWDLVTSENKRGFHTNAQPTLTDLYRKIDPVVNRLGYEKRITMDVRSALKTRINSLRIGGKGLMLDTRKSISINTLIQQPTVLELEQVGDDDEKAFIIGLLLTFLHEYYVSKGLEEGTSLSHITVVEEAHRLFKNVPTIQDTELANMRGKAVETFCNILSEIRAYGEGFFIAEQIPSKLAPDIVKNTNLKIMHRIVAEDDRIIMGGTMNLKDEEERYVASLNVGEAAVYSEGDDNSILVEVPYSKIKSPLFIWDEIPGNDNIRLIEFLMQELGIDWVWVKKAKIEKIDNGMTIRLANGNNFLSLKLNNKQTNVKLEINDLRADKFIAKTENGKLNIYKSPNLSKIEENIRIHETMKSITEEMPEVFVPFENCSIYCKNICKYKKEAENIVEDSEFIEISARYILSVVMHDSALLEGFPQLIQNINKFRKSSDSDSGIVLCTLINGTDYYFESMGKQYGWKYSDVESLKKDFLSLMNDIVLKRDEQSTMRSSLSDEERNRVMSFQNKYKNLCKRKYYPFAGCERVCRDKFCLYRYNLKPLLINSRLDKNFTNTLAKPGDEQWKKLGAVCQVPIRRVIVKDAPAEEKRKIALCFVIQKAESMPAMDFFLIKRIVTSMIKLPHDQIT